MKPAIYTSQCICVTIVNANDNDERDVRFSSLDLMEVTEAIYRTRSRFEIGKRYVITVRECDE